MPVTLTIADFERQVHQGYYTVPAFTGPTIRNGNFTEEWTRHVQNNQHYEQRLVSNLEELYGTSGFPKGLRQRILDMALEKISSGQYRTVEQRVLALSAAYKQLCELIGMAMEAALTSGST